MRVFLHTGAMKTGTTAIQSALAAMRGPLAEAGIHYPLPYGRDKAAKVDVVGGNGAGLGLILNPRLLGRAEAERPQVIEWVRACIAEAGGRDLLFSSESMRRAKAQPARKLCELFAAAGYQVTVIFYVRHLVDHAISLYLQALKLGEQREGGKLGSLTQSEFLRDYASGFVRSLEPFASILPRDQIVVRLYDQERHDLVGGFLRLLTDRSLVAPRADKVTNRSPSAAEQVVFQHLAARPDGPRLCRMVARLLLHRDGPPPAPMSISEADFVTFSQANQPVVDAINERFLPASSRLAMKSDKVIFAEMPAPSTEEVMAVFARCLALIDEEGRGKRARRAEAARSESS